jgi:hypothetical protein
MRSFIVVVSCCAVLSSWACDGEDGNGTLIGATCNSSQMCGPVGVCLTAKAGMCTIPCSVSGGLGECPLGSLCDEGEFESDVEAKTTMTLCLPQCKDDDECRDGYACNGVSSGKGKVCTPK